MYPDDVPTLTDGRVTLRAATFDDAGQLLELVNDPRTVEYTENPAPFTLDQVEEAIGRFAERWEERKILRFIVDAPDDGGTVGFAGTASLHDATENVADIGFSVHPALRGRGIATAAVRLICEWGFATQGLDAIGWRSQAGNYSSWRVAWANGFTFDGASRRAIAHRGEARDAWRASLLRDDSREPKTPWLTPKRLEGAGVVLRDLSARDERRYVEAVVDPVSDLWLSEIPLPRTSEQFTRLLRDHLLAGSLGRSVQWTVADPVDDSYLGSVNVFGMNELDHKSAEIGYRTHPGARGRGVVKAALRAAIAHAFTAEPDGGLDLNRVQLLIGEGNASSQRVAAACGFTPTGRDRQCYLLGDGRVVDMLRFDLLRTEWRAMQDDPASVGL